MLDSRWANLYWTRIHPHALRLFRKMIHWSMLSVIHSAAYCRCLYTYVGLKIMNDAEEYVALLRLRATERE